MSRSRVLNIANFEQFSAINVLSDPGHIGGPVVIPNAIKVMLVWTLTDGKIGRNVLGGTVTGSFNPTTAIAESIRSALTTGGLWTALAAFMPTTGSLTRVELLDIRSANQAVVPSTGAAAPGTSASAALPSEVAFCLNFKTARTGPSGRGRMYIPNAATNALGATDLASTAYVTAVVNWATNIPTVLSGQGITHALLLPARSQYTGSTGTVHPARAASTLPITTISARNSTWDSQRRRGLK